jgi:non-ribosomal peptide synthetase component F
VAKYPDRVAVKTRDSTWTYDELNQAAYRIARAILAECGEHNEPIAVLLDQGAPPIAAFFRALKVGMMVVPLDPSYPRARIREMLEHSQPTHIVTDKENCSLASDLVANGVELIDIDEIDVRPPIKPPKLSGSPGALAYILYTSGSTGKPKGVLQKHRNVLHQITVYSNTLHVCAADRFAFLLP